MRALQISAYGGDPLNVLELVDILEPGVPGEAEVLMDVGGGDATATLVQLLSDRGVLVAYSAASGRPLVVNGLFINRQTPDSQRLLPGRFRSCVDGPASADRSRSSRVASGALRVPVAAVYPMSKIKEAVTHLLNGRRSRSTSRALSMPNITTVQFEESELSWSRNSNRSSRRNRRTRR